MLNSASIAFKDCKGDGDQRKSFLVEFQHVMSEFFLESDIAFVYVDAVNELTIIWKDIYGKRSLLV